MNKEFRYYAWENLKIGFTTALFLIWLQNITGCSAPKKSQAQKDYEAREQKIIDLKELRKLYPCDTATVTITKTDTTYLDNTEYTLTRNDTVFKYKDRVITRTVEKNTIVVDSAAIEESRLSGMQKDTLLLNCTENANKLSAELVISQQEVKALKGLRRGIYWGLGILAAAGLVLVFFKLKKIFL